MRHFSGALNADALEKLMTTDPKVDVIAALVIYDEPSDSNQYTPEAITQYARCTLRVNGVTQPGG